MKRSIRVISLSLFIAASLPTRATVYTSIPNVFSTGVDSSGNVLAAGTVDPHYTITSSPSGATSARVTAAYYLWSGNSASSAWINGSGSDADATAGDYTYTTTFSLTGFDPATASISGSWLCDNNASIYLNGVATGITHTTPYEFLNFDAFTLNAGFVPGLNTLTFAVNNIVWGDGNPTGLQVKITSAVAVVPEPSSLALLSVLLPISLLWRKARRH